MATLMNEKDICKTPQISDDKLVEHKWQVDMLLQCIAAGPNPFTDETQNDYEARVDRYARELSEKIYED